MKYKILGGFLVSLPFIALAAFVVHTEGLDQGAKVIGAVFGLTALTVGAIGAGVYLYVKGKYDETI